MTASGAVIGSSISNANGTAAITNTGNIGAQIITATCLYSTGTIRAAGDIIAFSFIR